MKSDHDPHRLEQAMETLSKQLNQRSHGNLFKNRAASVEQGLGIISEEGRHKMRRRSQLRGKSRAGMAKHEMMQT